MNNFEVEEPILNTPDEEPSKHWFIEEGKTPEKMTGRRDGRRQRLFFAQLEAAETMIFLNEARSDFLQGGDVPLDEPSEDRKADATARMFIARKKAFFSHITHQIE